MKKKLKLTEAFGKVINEKNLQDDLKLKLKEYLSKLNDPSTREYAFKEIKLMVLKYHSIDQVKTILPFLISYSSVNTSIGKEYQIISIAYAISVGFIKTANQLVISRMLEALVPFLQDNTLNIHKACSVAVIELYDLLINNSDRQNATNLILDFFIKTIDKNRAIVSVFKHNGIVNGSCVIIDDLISYILNTKLSQEEEDPTNQVLIMKIDKLIQIAKMFKAENPHLLEAISLLIKKLPFYSYEGNIKSFLPVMTNMLHNVDSGDYLAKIGCCSILNSLAFKLIETRNKVDYSQSIIEALNYASKDRVLKVQIAASETLSRWNMLIEEKEETKTEPRSKMSKLNLLRNLSKIQKDNKIIMSSKEIRKEIYEVGIGKLLRTASFIGNREGNTIKKTKMKLTQLRGLSPKKTGETFKQFIMSNRSLLKNKAQAKDHFQIYCSKYPWGEEEDDKENQVEDIINNNKEKIGTIQFEKEEIKEGDQCVNNNEEEIKENEEQMKENVEEEEKEDNDNKYNEDDAENQYNEYDDNNNNQYNEQGFEEEDDNHHFLQNEITSNKQNKSKENIDQTVSKKDKEGKVETNSNQSQKEEYIIKNKEEDIKKQEEEHNKQSFNNNKDNDNRTNDNCNNENSIKSIKNQCNDINDNSNLLTKIKNPKGSLINNQFSPNQEEDDQIMNDNSLLGKIQSKTSNQDITTREQNKEDILNKSKSYQSNKSISKLITIIKEEDEQKKLTEENIQKHIQNDQDDFQQQEKKSEIKEVDGKSFQKQYDSQEDTKNQQYSDRVDSPLSNFRLEDKNPKIEQEENATENNLYDNLQTHSQQRLKSLKKSNNLIVNECKTPKMSAKYASNNSIFSRIDPINSPLTTRMHYPSNKASSQQEINIYAKNNNFNKKASLKKSNTMGSANNTFTKMIQSNWFNKYSSSVSEDQKEEQHINNPVQNLSSFQVVEDKNLNKEKKIDGIDEKGNHGEFIREIIPNTPDSQITTLRQKQSSKSIKHNNQHVDDYNKIQQSVLNSLNQMMNKFESTIDNKLNMLNNNLNKVKSKLKAINIEKESTKSVKASSTLFIADNQQNQLIDNLNESKTQIDDDDLEEPISKPYSTVLWNEIMGYVSKSDYNQAFKCAIENGDDILFLRLVILSDKIVDNLTDSKLVKDILVKMNSIFRCYVIQDTFINMISQFINKGLFNQLKSNEKNDIMQSLHEISQVDNVIGQKANSLYKRIQAIIRIYYKV